MRLRQKPCTTIGAPAPNAPASKLCYGRTTASKVTRSRPGSRVTPRQVCSAGRSQPPVKPGKSTSMSMARWPDAFWPRLSFPMAAPLPWRATKCALPNPNSPFGCVTDLPARSAPYTLQQVLDAVDTLHPAIEIPDSRFADFVSAGAAQIIADNACAHLFVLGPPAASDWRALDLVEERPIITLRGQQFIGHGKNVLGDPRLALLWLANELRQLGITLKAGRVVTTGTCHPPLPIQSGDFLAADFGSLGKVSVGFDVVYPSSLRATGSCEHAPDDRLREAIHLATARKNGLLPPSLAELRRTRRRLRSS